MVFLCFGQNTSINGTISKRCRILLTTYCTKDRTGQRGQICYYTECCLRRRLRWSSLSILVCLATAKVKLVNSNPAEQLWICNRLHYEYRGSNNRPCGLAERRIEHQQLPSNRRNGSNTPDKNTTVDVPSYQFNQYHRALHEIHYIHVAIVSAKTIAKVLKC